ncbi:hypothetical protein RF11_13531 [Thelohanellus kitauei]|uniref:Uncharacterized protein n=1 Tax=Thelohanellus kitauei TaxID=669202 RepID=A0A0C2MPC1_THEKT|nr:hypothetical protein RF11_13531 [Thelohanellus kitauei]
MLYTGQLPYQSASWCGPSAEENVPSAEDEEPMSDGMQFGIVTAPDRPIDFDRCLQAAAIFSVMAAQLVAACQGTQQLMRGGRPAVAQVQSFESVDSRIH